MKIALIGYGKMGKTIERIALERGHEIVSIIVLNACRNSALVQTITQSAALSAALKPALIISTNFTAARLRTSMTGINGRKK